MFVGYYPPKRNRKKSKIENPRIACIMPVYVGSSARTHYIYIGEDENKEWNYLEDKLESIKFSLECHKKFKTNLAYDIILINNGTENQDAINFYISTGLKVLSRENKGFSFGAFKYAWENLKDYDYYLFIEADHCPSKDYWLEELVSEFEKEGVGAVGNVLETRGITKKAPFEIYTTDNQEMIKFFLKKLGRKDWMCNLDGAYTFTSKEVLNEAEKFGGMKVFTDDIEPAYMGVTNELAFQQSILRAGYSISAFGHQRFSDSDRIYFFGIRSGDLIRPFDKDKLAPIVNGNTRHNCQQMKQYFHEIFQ